MTNLLCHLRVNKNYFSKDKKKASDAAYLLSFSIIMINTDLHNKNIQPDCKMTVYDFVKNNQDFGRDITVPGHEFPPTFLEGMYESIREETIRNLEDLKELVLGTVWVPMLSALCGFRRSHKNLSRLHNTCGSVLGAQDACFELIWQEKC